jgi:hypothetical protein
VPTYEYRCDDGHVTELVMPMADDKPESVPCAMCPPRAKDGGCPDPCECDCSVERAECGKPAARVFLSPIAVHWDGTGGSYYEDSYRNDSGRYGWKRRPNAGDDLPVVNL